MEDQIRKLYIEPSSKCNLNCSMCPRNTWIDGRLGHMDYELFCALIDQAHQIGSLETIFFGGVAEPLSHPAIVEMVKRAKKSSIQVELISNGSQLNEQILRDLLEAGLDTLWVSIDQAHKNSHIHTAGNNGYQSIIENLQVFRRLRWMLNPRAKLGITYVAMKSNIADLPEILALARAAKASEVRVSNLIPYTKEMEQETLYDKTFNTDGFLNRPERPEDTLVQIPVLDFNRLPPKVLSSIFMQLYLKIGENRIIRTSGCCKFIEEDRVYVRWDGEVSPCFELLHSHKTYLHGVERTILHCSFGNVGVTALETIWNDSSYVKFRSRVKEFSFSPCTSCGICEYAESNQEDCFGNPFPTCGGCLWAEGFAQCP